MTQEEEAFNALAGVCGETLRARNLEECLTCMGTPITHGTAYCPRCERNVVLHGEEILALQTLGTLRCPASRT